MSFAPIFIAPKKVIIANKYVTKDLKEASLSPKSKPQHTANGVIKGISLFSLLFRLFAFLISVSFIFLS